MTLNVRFQLKSVEDNIITFMSSTDEIQVLVLEEDMYRVYMPNQKSPTLTRTWTVAPGMQDVPYEGRDRFDLSPFTLPVFVIKENDDYVTIKTNKLKASVRLEGFRICWYMKKDEQWINIASDRQTQSYNVNQKLGSGVFHYLERHSYERYYGLGEKTGYMNRHHKRYRMEVIDAMGYDAEFTDPTYKHIPFYITNNSEENVSYGLFYDNLSNAVFDLGLELDNYHGHYRYYHAEQGDLDYYFILGPRIKDVVQKYSYLTGKMVMPPKWSIGYSGSTMSYTDAPDAQEQLKKFVDSCKEHDIPCDSFQLSSGYTSIGHKRYVFNWNYDKVPDPKGMATYFDDHGMRLCANIKPCLLEDHPQYDDLKKKGYFVKDGTNENPELVQFWDGAGAWVDFTNEEAYNWWKDNIKKQLLDYGITSTWNDNNEYEIWNEDALAHYFGETFPVNQLKPIQSLLMIKASFEAQKEYAPDIRPYLITRSGPPGLQRYVQTWSGDNYTEWKTIRFNNKMGLSLSLSGIYNLGHDVGGFSGMPPEPELFIRWIQNGIFHPRFTIHSWNDDDSANVPWMYPEHIEVIRHYMKERVKWMPYIYHLFHEAVENYQPIITPTFYYFEEDANTFEENNDFLLGRYLLVCSIVEKGQRKREVYLPKNGHGWFDISTDVWYEGGQTIEVEAPLDHIPLFAQGGAIIPIRDGEITFEEKEDTERGIYIFPPKGTAQFSEKLYDDDGFSMKYKQGEYTYINVKVETTETTVQIEMLKEGNYVPPYEEVNIYLPESEQRSVTLNGENVEINNMTWKLN